MTTTKPALWMLLGIGIGLLPGGQLNLPALHAQAQAQPAPAASLRYRVVAADRLRSGSESTANERLEKRLEEQANAGWELVCFTTTGDAVFVSRR